MTAPVRIAILSDTHGQLDARIEALVAGCDLAVHGGDLGNAAVLTRLRPRSGKVAAVLGNNDVPHKWPAADQDLLQRLPERQTLELPGGSLVVVHGHRTPAKDRHTRLRRQHPDARAIVYGHSHRLSIDRDALPWVLNPGAAGRARTYGGPSCLVLLAGAVDWQLECHRFPPPAPARRADAGPGPGRRPRPARAGAPRAG